MDTPKPPIPGLKITYTTHGIASYTPSLKTIYINRILTQPGNEYLLYHTLKHEMKHATNHSLYKDLTLDLRENLGMSKYNIEMCKLMIKHPKMLTYMLPVTIQDGHIAINLFQTMIYATAFLTGGLLR